MEKNLRLQKGITRQLPFYFQVNGEQVIAYPGETIAVALLAAGWKTFRHTNLSGEPRGMYCGMGLCYDCLVTVNGHPNVRACVTMAQPGDVVERQL